MTPGQATGGWSGTSGTIELTPLISREGGSTCDFCGDKSASQLEVNAQLIPLPADGVLESLFKSAAK